MRLLFLSITFYFLFQNLGLAQKDGGIEKADEVYEKLGYREAIDLYISGELDLHDMQRIANSYRLNHETQNAEKWYAQIVQSSDNPMHFLHYAQVLQSNGKLKEAKENYLKYDKIMGDSGDGRGSRHAGVIDRMEELHYAKEIETSNAWAINSSYLDFSPVFYQNGIVFISTREPQRELVKDAQGKDLWTGQDFAALYFAAKKENGDLGKVENFSSGLASRFHEGPLTFNREGDQLFFTRNEKKRKGAQEVRLQIFVANKEGDSFGEATKLDLADNRANDAHPTLAADGQKLYFSSDRAGGYGGMDLYVTRRMGEKWGLPVNLGPSVNTAGNEVFPFIHDNGTLYFASDGWGGLGGLDIFFAEQQEENMPGKAVNIGAPFNSNMDDFGYVLNRLETEGYFTSARAGGMGKDDIYHFNLPTPQANKKQGNSIATIVVYDQATGERITGARVTVLVEGEDGSYLGFDEDLIVKLLPADLPGEFVIRQKKRDPFAGGQGVNETYTTDLNGSFRLPLNAQSNYFLISKKTGYQEVVYELDGSKGISERAIPMMSAKCIALNGRAMNKEHRKPLTNVTISLVNLCTGESMSTRTDVGGHYSFCLESDCDFVLTGSKPNFKDASAMVTTTEQTCDSVSFGPAIFQDVFLVSDLSGQGGALVANYREEGQPRGPEEHWPTDPEVLENMMKGGAIIELEDIYYDLGQSNIRPDAAIELDKVVGFMRRNPEISVEIRSHTDSRASREYNRSLSASRANTVEDYLVKKGIRRDRITASGFGEDLLTNDCADGVQCSEEAHQMNRRTEIRVFK